MPSYPSCVKNHMRTTKVHMPFRRTRDQIKRLPSCVLVPNGKPQSCLRVQCFCSGSARLFDYYAGRRQKRTPFLFNSIYLVQFNFNLWYALNTHADHTAIVQPYTALATAWRLLLTSSQYRHPRPTQNNRHNQTPPHVFMLDITYMYVQFNVRECYMEQRIENIRQGIQGSDIVKLAYRAVRACKYVYFN